MDFGTTFDRSDCSSIQILPSVSASVAELPPPHRFRRQSCPDIQGSFVEDVRVREQDLDYLASHRAATAKLLNAEMEGAQPLSQEEVLATARQLSLWHRNI
uniref:Uncharacterized protein n=1 Tax=Cryptomonas curvata TaxID=233186 RepID=A0A7S0LZM5_9CRYP|mmetsp:Transcript_17937/g.37863  ORF Transcript_17937/g.37863 Transcript_17937/m.37863 type:complete len:101 (+) Transcript_17937:2-304(+)